MRVSISTSSQCWNYGILALAHKHYDLILDCSEEETVGTKCSRSKISHVVNALGTTLTLYGKIIPEAMLSGGADSLMKLWNKVCSTIAVFKIGQNRSFN